MTIEVYNEHLYCVTRPGEDTSTLTPDPLDAIALFAERCAGVVAASGKAQIRGRVR